MIINSNANYYLPKQSSSPVTHAPSLITMGLPGAHTHAGSHIGKPSQPTMSLPRHTSLALQPKLQGSNTLSRGHDIAEEIDGKF